MKAALLDQFAAAWEGTRTGEVAERLAMEVAAFCTMEGRWYRMLVEGLQKALSRGTVDSAELSEILLPAERDIRVAVVVEGASQLESATGLLGSAAAATTIAADSPAISWGVPTTELVALADQAGLISTARNQWSSSDHAVGHVLLVFTVRARDFGGAAHLGRLQASELLDQYVAGQRVAELRLRPETLVSDPRTGRYRRFSMPALGSAPADPLTTNWPSALRECLRTAHIARVIEAPMTAAGLSWVALEALEVKSERASVNSLARALSLQALRQQLTDLHHQVRTSVLAAVRARTDAVRAAESRVRSLETSFIQSQHSAVKEQAEKAHAAALHRYTALEQAKAVDAHRVSIDAWTRVGSDGTLHHIDRWLDVFAADTDAEPVLRAAADALSAIAEYLTGEVGFRLQAWRTLLSTPPALATWIDETATDFEVNLEWLYTLRNTALHDGRFASSTDTLDAHTGRALVDLTLEFLGNWYTHVARSTPELTRWNAIQVIEHLGKRQESVLAELRRGTRSRLNVTRLTSPTSTGWDRVPPSGSA
ncbi:hypothetical protein OG874_02725 [Nocardia sp. NBC_00565]|uniref:hypothetical protein n=1 Tax=Nocardia sp. NBC_00565 TaxID=2975993 RepID=UPI002E8116DF|nr:hypothetical protein [Nocardia sp. NBC_00565]WUC04148.1 hypothetical protein OG874_02725 [Nocardia sp. NBC_00565]